MSFTTILDKKGRVVKLIKITRSNKNGYVETSEKSQNILALIFPLTQKELEFWTNAGIERAKLKAYVNVEVRTGDIIEVDGVRYLVRAYENWGYYLKLILESHS